MFVYGQMTCRGDNTNLQFEVSDDLISEAVNVARSGDDALSESFVDKMEDVDYHTGVLLTGIATDSNTDLSKWDDQRIITVFLEECEFGVAPTSKEAKLAWVDLSE